MPKIVTWKYSSTLKWISAKAPHYWFGTIRSSYLFEQTPLRRVVTSPALWSFRNLKLRRHIWLIVSSYQFRMMRKGAINLSCYLIIGKAFYFLKRLLCAFLELLAQKKSSWEKISDQRAPINWSEIGRERERMRVWERYSVCVWKREKERERERIGGCKKKLA